MHKSIFLKSFNGARRVMFCAAGSTGCLTRRRVSVSWTWDAAKAFWRYCWRVVASTSTGVDIDATALECACQLLVNEPEGFHAVFKLTSVDAKETRRGEREPNGYLLRPHVRKFRAETFAGQRLCLDFDTERKDLIEKSRRIPSTLDPLTNEQLLERIRALIDERR